MVGEMGVRFMREMGVRVVGEMGVRVVGEKKAPKHRRAARELRGERGNRVVLDEKGNKRRRPRYARRQRSYLVLLYLHLLEPQARAEGVW